jgi:hypothetical protein
MYKDNLVYNVRGTFLHHSSHLASYWFAMVCAFVVAIMFNIAITTLRVSFFPKDADVFAELEKDPIIKARFEEEAASELQQSWSKGNADDELQALLNQPRTLEEGFVSGSSWRARRSESTPATDSSQVTTLGSAARRPSLTESGVDEEIAQRFGAVIRKPFKQPMTNYSASG